MSQTAKEIFLSGGHPTKNLFAMVEERDGGRSGTANLIGCYRNSTDGVCLQLPSTTITRMEKRLSA